MYPAPIADKQWLFSRGNIRTSLYILQLKKKADKADKQY
jgi:hypothetical protein